MTEADLERAIAADEDERDLEPDWTRAELVLPRPRQSVHLWLERKVVEVRQSWRQGPLIACKPCCARETPGRTMIRRWKSEDM